MRVYIDQHVGIAIPRRFPASVGSIDTKGRLSAVVTNCRPAGAEVGGRTSRLESPFAGAPAERVLVDSPGKRWRCRALIFVYAAFGRERDLLL